MKELIWIASSKKDLLKLPKGVIDFMGYALYLAQMGDRHKSTKSLKGFGDSSVIEILENDSHGTYRVVYTLKISEVVFVLHSFQKKSKQGIKTSKEDIDLIKSRIKLAEEIYKERYKDEKK